jgi:pyrimidine-nucleoside phosphorylase
VRAALASGAGLAKFQEVIALQGGDPRVCDDVSRLPRAQATVEVTAEGGGYVTGIACRAVGQAAMLLGAGRETVDSRIDPAVGIVLHKKVGDAVASGDPLASVHVNDRGRLEEATSMLRASIRIGEEPSAPRPLVHAVLQ